MSHARRIRGFIIGATLGCGLVWLLVQSRPRPERVPVLRPWQGPVHFVLDAPVADDGSWKRIRIIEDPGWHRLVRLEEVLKEVPSHRGSQVLERKAIAADSVWVLPIEAAQQSHITAWVQAHGGRIVPHEAGPWSIELEGEGDLVPPFITAANNSGLLKVWEVVLPDPTAR